MEFEQLIKRLDWLDEEQRKTKSSLEETIEQLKSVESENKTFRKKLKELSGELTKLVGINGRVDEFNAALIRHRKEINKYISDAEEKRETHQIEVEKRFHGELDGMTASLGEIHKLKENISEVKREMKGLSDEENRRNKTISAAQEKMEGMLRVAEEAQLSIRASDANRNKDVKKLADLQGEVASLKKRIDETRDKGDIIADNIRRFDVRLGEIVTSEAERRQGQTAFIENQNMVQLERDRGWKAWQEQIESIGKQTALIDAQLQNWDIAQRAVKRAQDTYEDITNKFERRINEITEIQRLSEDRYRQEWVTFKADEQKRWTSFSLNQDETRKDIRVDISKQAERITFVEDLAQTLQDIIQQTRDADEQMLQGILSQIHELLSAYERIKGTS